MYAHGLCLNIILNLRCCMQVQYYNLHKGIHKNQLLVPEYQYTDTWFQVPRTKSWYMVMEDMMKRPIP